MSTYTGLYLKIPAQHRDLRRLEYPVKTILDDMDGAFVQEDIQRISLAVHELCLYIIAQGSDADGGGLRHRGTCLTLVVEPQEDGCKVLVSVPAARTRALPEETSFSIDDTPIENLGLWSAQHLMDEVACEPQAGYDRWRMVKYAA